MASMLVRDYMLKHPPHIKCGTSVDDAVERLLFHRLLGLPVVDDALRVVGFVSEQDCIHAMLVTSYHHEGSPTVDEVMGRALLTVKPDESIIDVAQRMGKDKPKSYPVVEDGRLIGLITRSSILQALWEGHSAKKKKSVG